MNQFTCISQVLVELVHEGDHLLVPPLGCVATMSPALPNIMIMYFTALLLRSSHNLRPGTADAQRSGDRVALLSR